MKKFIFENQDLVYEVPENLKIDSLAKGMLTNNNISGIAKTIFSRRNATQYIQFKIPSKVSVSQLFSGTVNSKRLVNVLLSIVDTMIELEEYMLDYRMLVLDLEHIYVNMSTEEVTMIYMPFWDDNCEFADVREFFSNIICKNIQFDQNEESNYVTQLINCLNNSNSFSLLKFKKTLEDITSSTPKHSDRNSNNGIKIDIKNSDDYKKDVKISDSTPNVSPKVVPIDTHEKLEITPVMEEHKDEKKKTLFGIFHQVKKEKVDKKTPKKKDKNSVSCKFAIPGQNDSIVSDDGKEKIPDDGSLANITEESGRAKGKSDDYPNYSRKIETDITVYDGFEDDEGTVVMDEQPKAHKSSPYLIRAKTKEKIFINNDIYKIGRNSDFNDYNINGNLLIGHSHCYIVAHNGEYFVVDNNSKNHTYIDNRIIPTNEETPIKNGQILRLANEEFEFNLN